MTLQQIEERIEVWNNRARNMLIKYGRYNRRSNRLIEQLLLGVLIMRVKYIIIATTPKPKYPEGTL